MGKITDEFTLIDERDKRSVSAVYDELFDDADVTLKKYYEQIKERIPEADTISYREQIIEESEVLSKGKTSPRVKTESQKSWSQVQKEWEREMNLRQDLNRLKRVLKDTTDQWRNEQAYEKLVREMNYQT
ncbi:hypothetical protein GQR36_27040 [Enterococcus termitis]